MMGLVPPAQLKTRELSVRAEAAWLVRAAALATASAAAKMARRGLVSRTARARFMEISFLKRRWLQTWGVHWWWPRSGDIQPPMHGWSIRCVVLE